MKSKKYHILVALCGEQNSQAALLRFDESTASFIRRAREALANMGGGSGNLDHYGVYDIELFSQFLGGFVDGVDEEDMSVVYMEPILIEDLDLEAFSAACERIGQPQRGSAGLRVNCDGGVWILAREKHADQETTSHEISELVESLLILFPSETPTTTPQ